mmetsp:Transcript_7237/g.11021  ORF Transcript_7237/g.11021 Transcript_7237/m.11021 type:complete len:134 (+) Transcript_7237:166-567(+)|eukprot:CAMPEP_0201546568 /NCGR_PEP_ID=MMETSP0173_2-20130828/2824_1 /ASSEMBLY_ACC=CAM_ASM_000268 /TAXON_ID=218659 /ORGANISM="Vexillifera sp., Strain DIVA3 564/2" /LENGTH=133 /DNA_ID=CAMNT_0047955251 /DNA_START=153 /DNA_END=554 /DNA_ORIENTATION=-
MADKALYDALWAVKQKFSAEWDSETRMAWCMTNWVTNEKYPPSTFSGYNAIRFHWHHDSDGTRDVVRVYVLNIHNNKSPGEKLIHTEKQNYNFAPTSDDKTSLRKVYGNAGFKTVCVGGWEKNTDNAFTAWLN